MDENRINNQQNEKQQKVNTPKQSFCRSNLFQTVNSQRLIGELIVYPWSRRPSIRRRRPQCSNIFFSDTAGPIKAKFYVEPGLHDQDGRHAHIW